MNPKERRLQSDFEKVKKLCNESGNTLRLVKNKGYPPSTYEIEYHCPSLVINNLGEIAIRHVHRVEINLGINYPLEKPTANMLTPVFNPHIFSHNAICLGVVWSAAETLDVLILRIGALLQLDPRVLDENSPANTQANLWVKANKNKIPLGNISFKKETKQTPRIIWE